VRCPPRRQDLAGDNRRFLEVERAADDVIEGATRMLWPAYSIASDFVIAAMPPLVSVVLMFTTWPRPSQRRMAL
jgi:hypothetical protein